MARARGALRRGVVCRCAVPAWAGAVLVAVPIAVPSAACAGQLWTLDTSGETVPVAPQFAADVADPLLGLFAGLLDAGAFGALEPALLDSIVTAAGGSRLPYRRIRTITREPLDASGRSRLTITFGRDVRLPVPYAVLGYHPGQLVATRQVVLEECALGSMTFRVPAESGMEDVTVDDVHLFGVREGKLQADVDAWLDWLMGDDADDIDVAGLIVLRREGKRFAVAFGRTGKGQGRSGAFDLTGDRLLFPSPRAYLVMGRVMRERWENALRQGWLPCEGR